MWRIVVCLLALGLAAPAPGAVTSLGSVRTDGEIEGDKDISAVALFGRFLALASDETTWIEVFEEVGDAGYRLRPELRRPVVEGSQEVDFEAMALSGNVLYVTGSHSWLRKKLDDKDSVAKNRRKLLNLELEKSRCTLARLSADPATGALEITGRINLREHLLRDPILGPFCNIPSKENGLDIEGLAADGDQLFAGLRSPVLRGNLVPVVILHFARPEGYTLRFLDLGGQGIRELQKVDDGFLVLGGPAADASGVFTLYWWDGSDQVPGADLPKGGLVRLGNFPKRAGKPEGMAVLSEGSPPWEILVVFDGVKGGAPERFRVTRD